MTIRDIGSEDLKKAGRLTLDISLSQGINHSSRVGGSAIIISFSASLQIFIFIFFQPRLIAPVCELHKIC